MVQERIQDTLKNIQDYTGKDTGLYRKRYWTIQDMLEDYTGNSSGL